MAYEISLRQECPRIAVSETLLKKIARNILRDLGFKTAVLSILLVDGPAMHRMNNRYLRHARVTDVLAFSQSRGAGSRKSRSASPKNQCTETDFLGDIALCLPTIRAQAKEYEHSFEEELQYCLCHGILHLIGYEDKSRSSFRKMHRKQKSILKRVAGPHRLPARQASR